MCEGTKDRAKWLTHEPPKGAYETLHNTAYIKDQEVFLRGCGHCGEDLSLCQYCADQCKTWCGSDLSSIPAEEFGDFMDCECPVALLYFIAVGAAEMREKLMRYEDADESNCCVKNQMNDEPRECPYCGSKDIQTYIVDAAYCECNNCGADGPQAEIDYEKCKQNADAAINEAYDSAIVLWNRRYADNAEIH